MKSFSLPAFVVARAYCIMLWEGASGIAYDNVCEIGFGGFLFLIQIFEFIF